MFGRQVAVEETYPISRFITVEFEASEAQLIVSNDVHVLSRNRNATGSGHERGAPP